LQDRLLQLFKAIQFNGAMVVAVLEVVSKDGTLNQPRIVEALPLVLDVDPAVWKSDSKVLILDSSAQWALGQALGGLFWTQPPSGCSAGLD
jgi:hypothetical protein